MEGWERMINTIDKEMLKKAQKLCSWFCPECAYRLGNVKTYCDGDYYSCICSDGYWEMVKGKWEWRKGKRPRKS